MLNGFPPHRKVDRGDGHFVGRHGEDVVEVVVPNRGIKQHAFTVDVVRVSRLLAPI